MAITVAVVGTPNVGKSTLFNAITGLKQKVGNFPGVTVEPIIGRIEEDGISIELIDVPGVYSLDATSEDEQLTVQVLRGQHRHIPKPDIILAVMSATDLEKCLVLFSSLSTLGIPTIAALTMVDSLRARGGGVDDIGLAHELGIAVAPVVGTKGLGIADVRAGLTKSLPVPKPLSHLTSIESRYAWAADVVQKFVKQGAADTITRRLDSVLLHPVWGSLVFLVVMALFFQSIFTWADPLMKVIERGFGSIQDIVTTLPLPHVVTSFISHGIVGGVGSVLVFLPQILILNLLVTFLEESGYLARAAFLVDRAMGVFGLQGRSFIPLLGSFACAIPGIMSARIIPSYRDRLATIMAAPLMTCSARLPVYVLIISAVIPAQYLWGWMSLPGLILASLYVLGAFSGLMVALTLKRTALRGAVVPFLIEFPAYRLPTWKSLVAVMVTRTRDFIVMAGTVIVSFSIILWTLTALPQAEIPPGTSPVEAQHLQLEQSFAADVGKAVQPLFAPLGFDWKITLGVLSSYAARETFISTMGQVYAADVSQSDRPLRDVLRTVMPLPLGLSLLVYYVYALQCISTIAIMRRETGSWRWPALAFAITFLLAYGASATTFYIAQALM